MTKIVKVWPFYLHKLLSACFLTLQLHINMNMWPQKFSFTVLHCWWWVWKHFPRRSLVNAVVSMCPCHRCFQVIFFFSHFSDNWNKHFLMKSSTSGSILTLHSCEAGAPNMNCLSLGLNYHMELQITTLNLIKYYSLSNFFWELNQ